ncbi:hypothetical protein WMY93_007849 [Mugilogobius chulae]|uniref:Uncharacterized protein n=1 Tax=Mugilogobius chulae TaxID=88201 RepID=A0AAW0PKQ5_9GOBI
MLARLIIRKSVAPWHPTADTEERSNCICQGYILRMILLMTVLLFGVASAQKVIQLTYCSIDEHNLRMDCKYSVPAESSEVYCKYTQGERLFDTTFPDEEQHAPWRTRAKVRLFPGNICRFLFKSLPNGKSNFTCNIKTPESNMVSKTSVVEKKLLLPCSAWSVLLQSCSGLWLTLMTLPMLLGINWLQTRCQWPV